MEKQELIEKPALDFEVKAEIKSLGVIEDNISEVKEKVIKLNEYYKNITFTEEIMKQASEEKAKVNKFKSAVAGYRKKIVAEYKKPIETFENTAKETEKILSNIYDLINVQTDKYNNDKKEKIKEETKQYFEEYLQSKNIDFVTFEQAHISITLNASKKSLQEQSRTFIDKIVDDLNLIETQEHKAEILVEYKQTLNVSQAITTVTNRFKAIEEEKRKQEEKVVHIEMNENYEISKRSYEELENVINKPLEQPITEKQEELFTMSFKVKNEPKSRLKLIKEFLENGGYDYE